MPDATVVVGWSNAELAAGVARAEKIVEGFGHHVETALDLAGIGLGVEGIHQLADEFGRFSAMSRELNEAPEALQRISYLAKENNTDVQSVVKALQKFGIALRDVNDEKAQSALKELNIDAGELLRLAPEQQLLALTQAYQDAEHRGSGLVEINELLGKGYSALLPILRGNIDAMKEMAGAPVLSEDQIKSLDEFGTKWNRFINTQKVQLAGFALAGIDFAKALGGGLTEGGLFNFNGDNFAKGFDRVARAQTEEAAVSKLAAEEGRKFARALAAEREEAERADLAYKKFTKTIAENVEEHERLAARIDAIRGQMDGIKLDLGESAERKLEEAQRHLEAINAQIESLQSSPDGGAGGEEAIARAQLEQKRTIAEILALKGKIADADHEAAKKRDNKLENIRTLEDELALLKLRAGHHDKAAAAFERELKIKAEAHRIAKETGASEEDALRAAREKADLEDKANKQRGSHHTHGYSNEQRAGNRFLNDSRLDSYYADRATPFFQRHPVDRAAQLAARGGQDPTHRNHPGSHGPSMSGVEKLLQQLIQEAQSTNKNLTAY